MVFGQKPKTLKKQIYAPYARTLIIVLHCEAEVRQRLLVVVQVGAAKTEVEASFIHLPQISVVLARKHSQVLRNIPEGRFKGHLGRREGDGVRSCAECDNDCGLRLIGQCDLVHGPAPLWDVWGVGVRLLGNDYHLGWGGGGGGDKG